MDLESIDFVRFSNHLGLVIKKLPNNLKHVIMNIQSNNLGYNLMNIKHIRDNIKYLSKNLQNLTLDLSNNHLGKDINSFKFIKDIMK